MPNPTPPKDWPSVLVPLPVRFTFDPFGGLYHDAMAADRLNVAEYPRHYVETARQLFAPMVPRLNVTKRGGPRTPEVITILPEWAEVEDDVRRWLA